jgi:replicative DNA helicase
VEEGGVSANGNGTVHVPPQNLEAERSVLGAMMVSAPVISDAVETGLRRDDFYRDRHRVIYDAIIELWEGSATPAVDALTVTELLDQRGQLDAAGGRAEVHSLPDTVPAPGNAGHYAQIVVQNSKLRRLLSAAVEIQQGVHRREGTPDQLLERAERELFAIDGETAEELRPIGDGLDQLIDDVEKTLAGERVVRRASTGFADLDRKLGGGFGGGWLCTLAARPSMGKTSLGLQLAAATAERGEAAAVFSIEMSYAEVIRRIAYARAGVSGQDVDAGRISPEQGKKVLRAANELDPLPLFVDETKALSPRHIRARCRRFRSRSQAALGLVVIDYLQLLDAERNASEPNRVQEIGEITRGLKLLAGELECPVVVLSQLNRKVEERTDKRPHLSDLRDSGRIEEDSDLVLFLYRDEYYDEESSDAGIAEVNVSKNRHGPTGVVKLAFAEHCARFGDLARER